MTLAKALANGLPIGAMLAKESVAAAFVPGSHASTFGGTPLVTAASLCVLKTLERENIIGHCAEVGLYFKERLLELKTRHDSVVDVRGLGLLLGMELNIDGLPLVQACLEKGFVINCVQGNTLRFVPPLIVQKAEIDRLIHCLDEIL
jgi:acetylornithine/succinyldiaminopimelate/putrescine aminotransferase